MAEESLVNYRNDLKSEFGDAWDELNDVISSLKGEFSESDRQEFRDCTNTDNESQFDTLSECLEAAAEEVGVASEFRKKINREDDLIEGLRSTGREKAQEYDVSGVVRETIDATSVSDTYSKCSNYAFESVEDDLNLGDDDMEAVLGFDSIETYQQCVSAAAEVEDLSSQLKKAYDTA